MDCSKEELHPENINHQINHNQMIKLVTISAIFFLQIAVAQTKTEKFDSLFDNLAKEGSFNGNVLIAEKGKVIYQKSIGYADIKTQEKLTSNSVFELASVTKQFTAMAVVLLQKQGKLSYDEPISKYLPELVRYKDITIKNLLNHTGGLPDYMDLMSKEENHGDFATNQTIIDLFAKLQPPVLFKPDEKFEYSNTGYALLGSIIERASKMSYGEYLHQNIFKPLKMKNTRVYRRWYKPEKIDNIAKGHIYSDSLQKMIFPDDMGKDYYTVYLDGIVGDGMVNSTTSDLLLWDRALYTDKLVNQKDKDLIFSSYTTKDNEASNYGFGWQISSSEVYGKSVAHSGGWSGYVTYIARYLDHDYTIILLQNAMSKTTRIPNKQVKNILFGTLYEADPKKIEPMAGLYKNEKGEDKELLFEQNKLYVKMDQEHKLELIPISENKFIADGFQPEVFYEFIADNNKITKYIVTQPQKALRKEAVKIK
ncbi:serine hydrolase [uncultured Flavobacterium sp.]|uniref:serine hydrolase domain-containing protein n=1 Tax=uncultured Flavobacterium sp. TaxID=165435 RepID=UPI0025E982B7|nr:serine hydrolase domain-containing protein [uncultured Flavobacterium sp.]